MSVCSTGFGECLNDEPNQNLAYQYQFSDYPPTIDRRRSASLYTKGPVYQKLPGSAYTADEQCAQTFEHETRRCPYMVSCLSFSRSASDGCEAKYCRPQSDQNQSQSVCLSVCPLACLRTNMAELHQVFWVVLTPRIRRRTSRQCVFDCARYPLMHYVLPVLWMTSCFRVV